MSFRVKSAAIAALALSSLTAAVAGGVSRADDNIPSIAATRSATSSALLPSQVRFAPQKEVVQPIGTEATAARELSSPIPDATDVIGVPDKNYTSLAALVDDVDTGAPLDSGTDCLATAIFYEARSESLDGQLAVGRVIVNRARSSRFGDSLCSVVKQPGQFSFIRGGRMPEVDAGRPAWKTAVAIARIAMHNAWESKAEGALYFHARRVSPSWGRRQVATIDNHIFYR